MSDPKTQIVRVPLAATDNAGDQRPKNVAVVPEFATPDAAQRYRKALTLQSPKYRQGTRLVALALGPVIDEGDSCEVKEVLRARSEIELRIARTVVREGKKIATPSKPARPLAVVPLPADLAPGRYTVAAVWLTLDAAPSRRERMEPFLTLSFAFEIVP
ncbi:MAG: hypothetical protein ACKV22_36285 [Bryobacteraceae bacterium]